MNLLDLGEAPFWTRCLAALIALIGLAGVAAATFVGAMMLILFSADGSESGIQNEVLLQRTLVAVSVFLLAAVVVPPILLICKATTFQSVIPIGLGLLGALLTVLYYVTATLGTH